MNPSRNDHRYGVASLLFSVLSVALFLWVVSILLDGWALRLMARETHLKQVDVIETELASCREEQQGRLVGYEWIDREQARIRLPIERAMELVAEGESR